jgi:hypothetical protein
VCAVALAVGSAVPLATPLAAQQEVPRRLDFSTDTVLPPQQPESTRGLRNAFVRDQTVLGLTVYGPAFAVMVGGDGLTGTAGYLVMAGGSFFASAELARHVRITEGRLILSTAMAWRTAGSALLIASEAGGERRPSAAATLLGGLGGTAAGLYLARNLGAGEAAATVFGHDLAYVSAIALSFVAEPDLTDTGVMDERFAAAWTASGLLGYAAGLNYARRVPYNLTVGDVQTMWLGAGIGALGAATFIANSDPSNQATALTLLGGALAGTVAADRFLVRRYDHTRGEAAFTALGALAGSVMGVGVGVLVAGEARRDGSLTVGMATLGAVGGVVMAERYLGTARDAGRASRLGRLSLDPIGAVAAATRMPGRHSLLRYTF